MSFEKASQTFSRKKRIHSLVSSPKTDGEAPPSSLESAPRRPSIDSDSSAESMEAKMAELLLAEEAEEARETPEPTTSIAKTGKEAESEATKTDAKPEGDLEATSGNAKLTPPTPPAVKINGAAASRGGVEKSPVDAISTWSEDGCHVFMPNWGETSSTNVSLLGRLYSVMMFSGEGSGRRLWA